jgi:hypothetical protein
MGHGARGVPRHRHRAQHPRPASQTSSPTGADWPEARADGTLTPVGDGPFAYRWSNGATTPEVTVTAGAHNTYQRMSVTVTDLGENKSLTRTKTVKAQSEL